MKTAVTGATGTQGGAVVRALLASGKAVRAIVRDRHSPASMALKRIGAEIAEADLDDADSLHIALRGADALFSVQLAPGVDPDIERRQARILMDAARGAGIRHVVHSSVSNTGAFDNMAGWAEGRWERNYWESKRDAEDHVRHADFPTYSILRPAFMMDNFAIPKAQWMFPDLFEGKILTAIEPETPMVLIAAEDIGRVVAAAIVDPDRFGGRTIELAGDLLTLPRIASILTELKGMMVRARTLDPATLVERGQHAGWVQSQQWMNVVNYPARPADMEALGIAPTRFTDWVARHADQIFPPSRNDIS
ncbi:NmrA/HSCARG family protein [Sphingobium aromaticiconvertens]|uniref:NmrA/HSCARG family protein n=1 Tax=Sphingobium aromaticiconvertens TaxID=365341 RepID=UPI003017B198